MSSVAGGVMAAAAAAGGGGGGGGAPLHVLAVDDSSVDRAVIAGILRGSRFRGEWSCS
jgi:two-component response regulator (ARR-A family)